MIKFDFSKFTDLMKIDIKRAFAYRDSSFRKDRKKTEYTREDIVVLLDRAGIKYSKRLKSETLFKKALDNNLI